MPDISMCVGGDCPVKGECLRYVATPWYRQAYGTYPGVSGNQCGWFVAHDEGVLKTQTDGTN